MSQDISCIISTYFLKQVLHYGELVRYFPLCMSLTGVVDRINLSLVPTKVRGSAVVFTEFVIPFETEL